MCKNDLPFTHFTPEKNEIIDKVLLGRTKVESMTALFYFQKNNIIQTLIHRLKYNQEKEIGQFLAEMLSDHLLPFLENHHYDLIVPIPIHPKKLKLRGYNQAEVISETVSKKLKILHAPHLLARNKKINTQTNKNRQNRSLLSDNPFTLNEIQTKQKHILLIDDIITTGNTLEAACHILHSLNVKVSIAALAFTLKH